MTGDIWLADLARALADIRPENDSDAVAIARLLGFAAPLREDQRTGTATDSAPEPWADEPEAADAAADATGGEGAGAPAARGQTSDNLPLLQPVARRRVRATGWGARSLDRVDTRRLGTVPEREPLLPRRGAATILQTLTARQTPEGPLDVPAIVDLLARRQVLDRLPREAWPTLRFGVQILVDLALPMQPFRGDQLQAAARLKTIAGPQRTSVVYFADVPARGAGPGPRRTWRPYEAPERGTRVLVLSDFGLAGPPWHVPGGHPEDWRSFAGDLRRQGCDAVALLPVPAERWPRWLSALMPLVCWDRTATVGKVAAALRGTGEPG